MRNVLKSLLLVLSIQSLFAGSACETKIYNRGAPSPALINEFITWGNQAPDEIFVKNNNNDVFTLIKPKLAPNGWRNLKHRKSALISTLLVLAAYESSFDWSEGIDVTNSSSSKNKCNEEAGLFQTSGNIMAFDKSLKDLFDKRCRQQYAGNSDCIKFIKCSKDPLLSRSSKAGNIRWNHKQGRIPYADHTFTIEVTARALRFTTKHWGPMNRKSDVYAHLNPACQKEIEARLL